jgi:hypothetical protein
MNMGGSSGGGWGRLGDIRALEEKARAALQGGKRNVFISFAMDDVDEVNLLRAHAKNENSDIEFNDHSVREPYESDRAEYIKRKISERIERTSITVVYLSDRTVASDWVSWEVDRSIELGKHVVAVHAGEKFTGPKPAWIEKHGVKIVPWSRITKELK